MQGTSSAVGGLYDLHLDSWCVLVTLVSVTFTPAWAQPPGAIGGVVIGRAQTMPPRDLRPIETEGKGSIKGRVLDADTGLPVRRVTVRLQGGRGEPPQTWTDDDGAFVFGWLAAGHYTCYLEKAGYMPTELPEPGRTVRTRSGRWS